MLRLGFVLGKASLASLPRGEMGPVGGQLGAKHLLIPALSPRPFPAKAGTHPEVSPTGRRLRRHLRLGTGLRR